MWSSPDSGGIYQQQQQHNDRRVIHDYNLFRFAHEILISLCAFHALMKFLISYSVYAYLINPLQTKIKKNTN